MPRLGTVAKPLLLEFRNAWSRQIRALYFRQFMTKCPKSLHYLQTLAFLPNVLNINAPWSVLDIQTVAYKCGIHMECFFYSRLFLAQALANSSEFSLLCAEVLKYRLEKKQDCCTVAYPHGMYRAGERCSGPTPKLRPSFGALGKALYAFKRLDGLRVLLRVSSKLTLVLTSRIHLQWSQKMEACLAGLLS